MTKLKLASLLLVFTLILVACNNQTPATSPEITIVVKTDVPTQPSEQETAYPVTEGTGTPFGTIYPPGEEPTPLPETVITLGPTSEVQGVPEADAHTAAIYGILYSYSDQQPLTGVMIYAADVVIVETTGDKIYTTQEKSSPQDATDDRGQFAITAIKPGSYYFMMVTPFGNYPIFDDNNQTFELELKAGDVIDFGDVFVNWP